MPYRKRHSRYLIVIEKAGKNYSAYLPDVPGCISTGETQEEARENLIEALKFHFEGLKQEGCSKPRPKTKVGYALV